MTVEKTRDDFYYVLGLIALIALVIVPFGPQLANEIIIMGIFALGYNFLIGYGGELSFGHAAYFAIGGYATVLLALGFGVNLFLAIVGGVAIATVAAAVFGYVSLFRRGVAFAMITLGISQIVYYAILRWNTITGGQNGLYLSLSDVGIGPLNLMRSQFDLFIVITPILALLVLLIRYLIRTPFGQSLIAVRENELRAKALGYDTDRILLAAFTFSGAVSGLAGAFFALSFKILNPTLAFWTTTGEVVLITIIGGVGTLFGPILGAVVFVVLSDQLVAVTEYWNIVFGAFFILVVVFAPEGLSGWLQEYRGRRQTAAKLVEYVRNRF